MIKKSFLVTESKFQVTKKEIKKKFDHIKKICIINQKSRQPTLEKIISTQIEIQPDNFNSKG